MTSLAFQVKGFMCATAEISKLCDKDVKPGKLEPGGMNFKFYILEF